MAGAPGHLDADAALDHQGQALAGVTRPKDLVSGRQLDDSGLAADTFSQHVVDPGECRMISGVHGGLPLRACTGPPVYRWPDPVGDAAYFSAFVSSPEA